jgi:hypothetical protein
VIQHLAESAREIAGCLDGLFECHSMVMQHPHAATGAGAMVEVLAFPRTAQPFVASGVEFIPNADQELGPLRRLVGRRFRVAGAVASGRA